MKAPWGGLVAALTLVFVLGPWLWPHGYEEGSLDLAFQAPSWAHPLGTDELGRCLLARLLHGGRLSIFVALTASLLSALLGFALGIAAGGGGARWAPLMRAVDLMLSLPRLPVYMVLLHLLGGGVLNLVAVLVLFGWAPLARIAHGAVQSELGRPYMVAARASGGGAWHLARAHLLPNIASTLAVAASLDVRNRMMAEATLSYLGFGIPAPYPSWGGMVASLQAFLWVHPGALLGPLAALFLFSFAVQQWGQSLGRRWDPLREA